jgi:hypothetical protein
MIPLTLGLVVLAWSLVTLPARNGAMLPATLHNGAWVIALLIMGSGVMNYDPLSDYAWLVIASSIFAFNLAILMGGGARSRPLAASNDETEIRTAPLVTFGQYRFLTVLFSLGFGIYLVTIADSFGLTTLVTNPAAIRGYSTVSYMEAFPIYGKVLFYLGPLCLILTLFPQYVDGLKGRRSRLPLALYFAGAQVATLQRTNLFVCLVWAGGLIMLTLLHPDPVTGGVRINGRRLVALLAAVIVGLAVFQGLAVALGKTGNNNAAITSVVDPALQNSPLTGVLHYASSGVPAFGKLVESTNSDWPPAESSGPIYGDYNPQTWGLATFAGPLKLVPGIPHWQEIAPFIYLPLPTNVYTWLEPWYRDFRAAGVMVGSFLLGLVVSSVARRRYLSPEAMLLAGLLVGFTALATFVNRYMSVMSIVLYAAIWALGHARRRRERLAAADTMRQLSPMQARGVPHRRPGRSPLPQRR